MRKGQRVETERRVQAEEWEDDIAMLCLMIFMDYGNAISVDTPRRRRIYPGYCFLRG